MKSDNAGAPDPADAPTTSPVARPRAKRTVRAAKPGKKASGDTAPAAKKPRAGSAKPAAIGASDEPRASSRSGKSRQAGRSTKADKASRPKTAAAVESPAATDGEAANAKGSPPLQPKSLRQAPTPRNNALASRLPRTAGPSAYARLLLLGHRLFGDRAGGRNEFVSTAGFTGLGGEAFDDADRTSAYAYRATPRALIQWIFDELSPDYPNTTFVDFGAGRGRAVLEAARRPFLRCLGIEISPALHEDAEQNLMHWPRSHMACREVDYVRDSILRAELPDGPLLIWMFNPATERLILRVAARLAERATAGQQITLVYVDPRHDMPFRQAPFFRARAIRDWRIRLLSPYRVKIWQAGPLTASQS